MFDRIAWGIFLLMIPVWLVIKCTHNEPTVPAEPVNIESLHPDIVGVVHASSNDALEIIFNQKKVWNGASVIFGLASDATKVSAGLQKYFPKISEKTVRFTVQVPLSDKYGNETQVRVIAINCQQKRQDFMGSDDQRGSI